MLGGLIKLCIILFYFSWFRNYIIEIDYGSGPQRQKLIICDVCQSTQNSAELVAIASLKWHLVPLQSLQQQLMVTGQYLLWFSRSTLLWYWLERQRFSILVGKKKIKPGLFISTISRRLLGTPNPNGESTSSSWINSSEGSSTRELRGIDIGMGGSSTTETFRDRFSIFTHSGKQRSFCIARFRVFVDQHTECAEQHTESALMLLSSCVLFFFYQIVQVLFVVNIHNSKDQHNLTHTSILCIVFVPALEFLLDVFSELLSNSERTDTQTQTYMTSVVL